MNETIIAVISGAVCVVILLVLRWRWKKSAKPIEHQEEKQQVPAGNTAQVVHRLCPHHNVIQSFEVDKKDSLDEHLDVLTKKLAEKEGRLRLSKSKIRETQHEIENLQAIDLDVRSRYRDIMENLKTDLMSNEKECKKLQEQIEWVSQRRAELRDEVRLGQRLYGEAAAELASNLADLQRGRTPNVTVTDKPRADYNYSNSSLRRRKEPQLPRANLGSSVVIKTPPDSDHMVSPAQAWHSTFTHSHPHDDRPYQ